MYTNSSKSIQTASGCSWGGTRLVMWRTLELDLNLVLMFFAGDTITGCQCIREVSYARLTHTEHEEQKPATPLKRELMWCPPWWGWQLTRLLHWELSSTGFIHWGNQGPPAEASEAACNDLFWLCTCVYKHPMNRQLCLFSWHYCTRNSNTKLSRKRHPTPSKDMHDQWAKPNVLLRESWISSLESRPEVLFPSH